MSVASEPTDDQHRLVGKTISTNRKLWFEVHDAAEPGKVQLLPIDRAVERVLTHGELDERMENNWSIVYDGQTGELGSDD